MSDALLIYTLLKDYHAITPDLKALRKHQQFAIDRANHGSLTLPGHLLGELTTEQIEAHRHRATGWFNHVATLYLRNLIDERAFRTVASPQAARLWVTHVADLDKEVRRAVGGDAAAEMVPMAERFWREYAEGRLMTLQFVIGPQTTITEPARVQ